MITTTMQQRQQQRRRQKESIRNTSPLKRRPNELHKTKFQTKTKHIYRHRGNHTSIQTNRTTRQNNLHMNQAVQNKKGLADSGSGKGEFEV